MRIESKRLTFWRTFWLFVAGMSLPFLGLLFFAYSLREYLPWGVVMVAVLGELFFVLWAHWITCRMARVEREHCAFWQVTPTYVEVHCGERMLISFPWHEVVEVTFRRGVMGLKLHRREIHAFFLKGISESEYDQVEAIRRAGLSQG